MAGEPWTESDVEILAREYFAVLQAELAGERVNKNEALRRAQSALPVDRTIHTLKDRCYRISEELWKRDLLWVDGWKPPHFGGQSPNSVNVARTIWSAIEPLTEYVDKVEDPADSETPEVEDSQAYMIDAERRKAVEDVAQHRLMEQFRQLGWAVEDTHLTSPFDARATKGTEIQYLEAKGTTSDAKAVFVTSGEVDWARAHAGHCVMGIVGNIEFDQRGVIDPTSGTLRLVDWAPDTGELRPIQFAWSPPQN